MGDASVASRRGQGLPRISLAAGSRTRGHVLYSSHTIWASQEDFTAWTKSEQFRAAHQHAGERKPLTLGHPDSKGSKSSRRSKLRIHPHSGCSTLGIANRGIYGAGLTDAGTPCACFRDHEMSADAPKSHCGNPLLIKELRRPKLTGCDWQFFPRRNGVVGVPARVRAEKPTPSMCSVISARHTEPLGHRLSGRGGSLTNAVAVA